MSQPGAAQPGAAQPGAAQPDVADGGVAGPHVTVVVPTHDRPRLLALAVASALAQDVPVDVVVVDDGSPAPVALPAHPRLTVLRHETPQGGSAARNLGARHARTRWVLWLDDDDVLLPHAVRVALAAVAASTLPPPVAALSGIEVVDEAGRVSSRRLPPDALARGAHFFLEGPVAGRSYNTKQTLLVERDVALGVGGFDPTFRSRVHTDFFLRLNPVCSLQGVPEVTYRLLVHSGPRVSGDPGLRQRSHAQLLERHREAFAAHPRAQAAFCLEHARHSWANGQRSAALRAVARAVRVAPLETARRTAGALAGAGSRALRLRSRRPRPGHPDPGHPDPGHSDPGHSDPGHPGPGRLRAGRPRLRAGRPS
ncbi:glycosyltransferase family 2 protein [Pseudokineococcus sp. 1T1Z-3]|uniref:glycosyltransferase family 2 protein n=1 Tax=Pseudokineococcus sp. 1T1Z-3 TaxID=3132745 RepID=UPI00309B8DCA